MGPYHLPPAGMEYDAQFKFFRISKISGRFDNFSSDLPLACALAVMDYDAQIHTFSLFLNQTCWLLLDNLMHEF